MMFEEVPTVGGADTISLATFRCQGHIYTVSTVDIRPLHAVQRIYDHDAGCTWEDGSAEGMVSAPGNLVGNYETMLFVDGESVMPPFGDLPGWPGLGVFQRYLTEDGARDGHQDFVTWVQRLLSAQELVNDRYN